MSRKFTTKERWQVSIAISIFLIIALAMAGWLVQREKLVTIDTPLHKHSENHPAPYQDGVPHILLQESQDTWVPIRAKFIEGLLSEGNLHEHTKDYSIDTVQEKIKGIEDSAYSDEALPEDVETLDIKIEETTAYEHTESYRLESGKRLSVTIGYVNVGRNQQEFLVTDYRLYAE